MKRVISKIIVGTLVLFAITGCSCAGFTESNGADETKDAVSSDNDNNIVLTEAPNVRIDYEEISSAINVADYDREMPLFHGRAPIFVIENVNVGYKKLQETLSELSDQLVLSDRTDMLLQEEAYNNKSKQINPMSHYRIVYPQLCNTEYYSCYITDSSYVEGSRNAEQKGYVLDVKTGERVDITHFYPNRAELAELMRESYKNSEHGNYYNYDVDNYFNRIKGDSSYNFNYYLTDENVVVIVNGMKEMGASRNLMNLEIKLPRPNGV